MTPSLQIAIDCADCHRLNQFWAAAMSYEIEDHHDQVQKVLRAGFATPDDTVEIDGRLAWKTAAACRDPKTGTRLLFQVVPEPKTVKNRVHIDIHAPEGQQAEQVERLIALGASKLYDGRQGPLLPGLTLPTSRPLDRPLPLLVGSVGAAAVRVRLEGGIELPLGGDLVETAPHALGQPGQVGGPDRRGLLAAGPAHHDAQLIGLELQQQIHHRGAAVDP
jgi:hypothetical protein